MGPIVRIDRLAERELLISVSGELDLHSVGGLQDALDEAMSEKDTHPSSDSLGIESDRGG